MEAWCADKETDVRELCAVVWLLPDPVALSVPFLLFSLSNITFHAHFLKVKIKLNLLNWNPKNKIQIIQGVIEIGCMLWQEMNRVELTRQEPREE